MRTFTVRQRGRLVAWTLDAHNSESAALRVAQEPGNAVVAPASFDVEMHMNGRTTPVATYAWDGRDTTLVGRPSYAGRS